MQNKKLKIYIYYMDQLIIINIPFVDWKIMLSNNHRIKCIKDENIDQYNKYKIIPICIIDYIIIMKIIFLRIT